MAENEAAGGAEGAAPAAARTIPDPYRSYNFRLSIDEIEEGFFTYCSPPGARVKPIQFRPAGENTIVHQLTGRVEYTEVTLRYGLTNSPLLWEWMLKSIEGTPIRKNVSIIMQGPRGSGEAMRWNLNDAWPCAWSGAPLDALANEVAIESITLVYESLGRA